MLPLFSFTSVCSIQSTNSLAHFIIKLNMLMSVYCQHHTA